MPETTLGANIAQAWASRNHGDPTPMSDSPRPANPHPIHEIRAALGWARENGLRIDCRESLGVVCVSDFSLARWEEDPRIRLNPIGAAILRVQPQTSDPDEAATIAVGAPIAWIEGFGEGLAKLEPSKAWTDSIARAAFLQGYEAGTFTRAFLHRQPPLVVVPRGEAQS